MPGGPRPPLPYPYSPAVRPGDQPGVPPGFPPGLHNGVNVGYARPMVRDSNLN